MKAIRCLFIVFLYLLPCHFAQAQDRMFLRNGGEPFLVKVYEIGLDEIKYKPWGDTTMPVLVIPRVNVKKIVLSNGSSFEFSENPMTDPENYSHQHNQALKINFLSPLFANTAVSYERSIKPGRSYEVGCSIIGLGLDPADVNPFGMYLRGGYKFMSTPDFYIRGMQFAHILKGGYIKPELILGAFASDGEALKSVINPVAHTYSIVSYEFRNRIQFGAVMVNLGKQWVFENRMLFDMYVGLGYGFTHVTRSRDIPPGYSIEGSEGFNYAYGGGTSEFPLTIALGFKLGFVFGKKTSPPEHK